MNYTRRDFLKQITSPIYWTADGVHPTLAGSNLMAQAWLETAKRI